MELIDDQGRLLGLINIIDAVVVLFVLAVVIAGVAVITTDGESDTSTSIVYATIDLGSQPAYIADQIDEQDIYKPDENSNLTITDVYSTGEGNEGRIYLRVRLEGQPDGDTIEFGGEPPRLGRSLTIVTSSYQVDGVITSVSRTGPALPIEETPVLLRLTATDEQAAEITVGDEYIVAGRTVAEIESIDAYGTGNPGTSLLFVGVTYHTYHPRGQPQFAGQVVRDGAQLPFRTDDYGITGEVVRLHALEQRGQQTTRSVTLELEGVDPGLAESLRPGMTEEVRGTTIAEIQAVSVEAAEIVLISQDGEVFLREHPVDKDITITATLQVRESVSGIRFKGEPIRQGDSIVIDLGTITLRATISSL